MTSPFEKPNKLRIDLVNPQPHPEKGWNIIVLDRVDERTPDQLEYCIHGKVQCHRCREWCWLGDQTYKLVRSARVAGLCLPCAIEIGVHLVGTEAGHVDDRKRSDGPHE